MKRFPNISLTIDCGLSLKKAILGKVKISLTQRVYATHFSTWNVPATKQVSLEYFVGLSRGMDVSSALIHPRAHACELPLTNNFCNIFVTFLKYYYERI